MGAVMYPTLEHVAMEARPYPAYLLKGCDTGLVLFSAAFLGHNDAIHFAVAGLKTTCVDVDKARLRDMKTLYPDHWNFIPCDAWTAAHAFAVRQATLGLGELFDAVSVDTFTGEAMERSLASLDLWCSLARKLVTVTVTDEAIGTYTKPDGWRSFLFLRAPGVYWLVLSRGDNAAGEL